VQIVTAKGSPKLFASTPIIKAPIGINPKEVKVYTLITLPRSVSLTRLCIIAFDKLKISIIALPVPTSARREAGSHLTKAKNSSTSGKLNIPIVKSL